MGVGCVGDLFEGLGVTESTCENRAEREVGSGEATGQ